MGKQPIDSVGWGFFMIVFAILVIPAMVLMMFVVETDAQDVDVLAPFMFGIMLALFVAAVIAVITNSLLQARARRRETALEAEKKSAREAEKKSAPEAKKKSAKRK